MQARRQTLTITNKRKEREAQKKKKLPEKPSLKLDGKSNKKIPNEKNP